MGPTQRAARRGRLGEEADMPERSELTAGSARTTSLASPARTSALGH